MFFINPFIYAGGGDFESIATVTVGSGGASSVTFSGIPGTYQHLQIRAISKDAGDFASYYNLRARFNSDSGSNYARHSVGGSGSAAFAYGFSSLDSTAVGDAINSSTGQTSCFTANVIDILDYASTSKTKTVRSFSGSEWNGTSGGVRVNSGLWNSTSVITSITMFSDSNANLVQHCTFALYGLRA
jgi:hypothetical protein